MCEVRRKFWGWGGGTKTTKGGLKTLGWITLTPYLIIAKLSQAQTEASVLAEISFHFVFSRPPHPTPTTPGKVRKNQSCSK